MNRAVSNKYPSQPSKDFAAKDPDLHSKSNGSKEDASTPKTGLGEKAAAEKTACSNGKAPVVNENHAKPTRSDGKATAEKKKHTKSACSDWEARAPGSPIKSHGTPAKSKLDSVLKKHGFSMFQFDPSHGRVTSVKDTTQSPVKSMPLNATQDPFKTPKKPEYEEENEMVVVFKIGLVKSPSRSTSRGKHSQQNLGEDGTLYFFKSTRDGRMFVQYINELGVKNFDALAPLPEEASKFVKGNAGFENVFYWTALNKLHAFAGGTSIVGAKTPGDAVGCRRYYFWFESREELAVTLFFLLGQDFKLLNEFFKKDGDFTVTKKTLPPHAIYSEEYEMDTDDDGIDVDEAPDEDNDFDDDFDPGAESQLI